MTTRRVVTDQKDRVNREMRKTEVHLSQAEQARVLLIYPLGVAWLRRGGETGQRTAPSTNKRDLDFRVSRFVAADSFSRGLPQIARGSEAARIRKLGPSLSKYPTGTRGSFRSECRGGEARKARARESLPTRTLAIPTQATSSSPFRRLTSGPTTGHPRETAGAGVLLTCIPMQAARRLWKARGICSDNHRCNDSDTPASAYRVGVSRRRALPALSVRSRLNAALMRAKWVNACGKFPSASPLGPVCSAYSPRWLA